MKELRFINKMGLISWDGENSRLNGIFTACCISAFLYVNRQGGFVNSGSYTNVLSTSGCSSLRQVRLQDATMPQV